jgi:phosphoglycerate dehydrogenase-like enzyme
MANKIKIAILDDYQNVSLSMADWSEIQVNAEITVFNDHMDNESELVSRLLPFQVICVMRERTPLNRSLLTSLPNLELIASTGPGNASIDLKAATELGITVKNTEYVWTGAPEHTWALLMAAARHIPRENYNVHSGNWQTTIGSDISGMTLGIVGLGNVGQKVAIYARAFDMNIIAWSPNLTKEKADSAGVRAVDKETLFREADFVTIHMPLSDRSRKIIGPADLKLMKPSAFLINTSRGPLVDEDSLIKTLEENKIAGVALDVFDNEPLPLNHPFRKLENIIATPHIGFVTERTYRVFYSGVVSAIKDWINRSE